MKMLLVCLFLLLSPLFLGAQVVSSIGSGIVNFGSGNNSIAVMDEHAILNNQAAVSTDDEWTFVAGIINLYGFSSLNSLYAASTKKLGNYGVIGLSLKYLGDSELNEQLLGLSYSRKLTDRWHLGIQFDLLSYRSKISGNIYSPSVELGTIIKPTNDLTVGFHVFNPFGKALIGNPYSETLVRLGASYRVSEKVSILAEVQKFQLLPVTLNVGISYQVIDQLAIRTGYQLQGNQFHVGISYTGENVGIHGATAVHNSLGLSSGAGISFAK